mmetsp:Transcript_19037/g.61079  ORF Transcript_19037/g.61079 Transcript_19037/m.61079 type:complete len:278 (-) Transcript_19037:203-1036(-)
MGPVSADEVHLVQRDAQVAAHRARVREVLAGGAGPVAVLLRLVPVAHEYPLHLVPRPLEEERRHRRVHPARDAHHHALPAPRALLRARGGGYAAAAGGGHGEAAAGGPCHPEQRPAHHLAPRRRALPATFASPSPPRPPLPPKELRVLLLGSSAVFLGRRHWRLVGSPLAPAFCCLLRPEQLLALRGGVDRPCARNEPVDAPDEPHSDENQGEGEGDGDGCVVGVEGDKHQPHAHREGRHQHHVQNDQGRRVDSPRERAVRDVLQPHVPPTRRLSAP